MKIEDIKKQLEEKKVVFFPGKELDEFLDSVTVAETHDSNLGGMMRILKHDDNLFFQEITDKGEIAVRKMRGIIEAQNFINDRLNTYDRMWDGCGCRVDYDE